MLNWRQDHTDGPWSLRPAIDLTAGLGQAFSPAGRALGPGVPSKASRGRCQ